MRLTNAAAMNKPRLMLGMDRRAIALAFCASALSAAVNQNLLAAFLFIGLVWIGTRLAKRDQKLLEIWLKVVRQKSLYDPLKRELPQFVILKSH